METIKGGTLADFADEVNIEHPLTARRLPVLATPHPRWKYHVAIVITPAGSFYGEGLEPTPEEADQLAAYLDYRLDYYNATWRSKMLARPFDVDGTVNTFTFKKDPEVGWQYSAATWTMHVWFPQLRLHDDRFDTLEALLDHINTLGGPDPMPRWVEFKAASPAFAKKG